MRVEEEGTLPEPSSGSVPRFGTKWIPWAAQQRGLLRRTSPGRDGMCAFVLLFLFSPNLILRVPPCSDPSPCLPCRSLSMEKTSPASTKSLTRTACPPTSGVHCPSMMAKPLLSSSLVLGTKLRTQPSENISCHLTCS